MIATIPDILSSCVIPPAIVAFMLFGLAGAASLPSGQRPWDPSRRRLVVLIFVMLALVAALVVLARGFGWV
ncbi:MAG: hypothetical protein EBY09_10090 [Verrucomicrobia bacterium]|nr:hypothetical protein [Verrucomicrobiota bacterium]